VVVESTSGSATSEIGTAREYLYKHRGKVMVVQRVEGQPPRNEDFFQVESVGSHPSGLIITGVFEHNRRQNLRPIDIRQATEVEINSRSLP
jgi:hypothetical protein